MADDDDLSGEEIDAIVERELEGTPDEGVEHCPECNSTDLYVELGGFTGYRYHCKACNYVGPLVVKGKDPPGKQPEGS